MMVFVVTGFEPGHSWSGVMGPRGRRVFGPVGITYAGSPTAGSGHGSSAVWLCPTAAC